MTVEAFSRSSRPLEFAIQSATAEVAFCEVLKLPYWRVMSEVPPYYCLLPDGRRVDVIFGGPKADRLVVFPEELHFESLPDLYALVSGAGLRYEYRGMILASSVYSHEMTAVGDQLGYVVEESELVEWIGKEAALP